MLIEETAQQVNMRFMEKTGFNFQALQQPELPEPMHQYVATSSINPPIMFSSCHHLDASVAEVILLH